MEYAKEYYTPEEAYELVMSDIKSIYGFIGCHIE